MVGLVAFARCRLPAGTKRGGQFADLIQPSALVFPMPTVPFASRLKSDRPLQLFTDFRHPGCDGHQAPLSLLTPSKTRTNAITIRYDET